MPGHYLPKTVVESGRKSPSDSKPMNISAF